MSIQTDSPQITDQDLEQAAAIAEGLHKLADFITANPKLSDEMRWSFDGVNVPVLSAEPRQVIAEFARAGVRAGGQVEKSFNDQWSGVDITFGRVGIHVYASRDQVCERVVVGTTEVTKEVPDPAALAAVPLVKVTETVEEVEWRCTSLLADAVSNPCPYTQTHTREFCGYETCRES